MKFIRPVYLVFFVFLLASIFTTLYPHRMRGAPLGKFEYVVKAVAALAACIVFGYYSVSTALNDYRTVRGKFRVAKRYNFLLTSVSRSVRGRISGIGRCQIRCRLRRLAKDANSDELRISWLDPQKREVVGDSLYFAFNREVFEINITNNGSWGGDLDLRFANEPPSPFLGKLTIEVVGSVRKLELPESLT